MELRTPQDYDRLALETIARGMVMDHSGRNGTLMDQSERATSEYDFRTLLHGIGLGLVIAIWIAAFAMAIR